MIQKLLRLRAILDSLGGYNPQDALIKAHFQRRIYLLQAFGVLLGYKFLYSPIGPASIILVRDLHNQEFDYDVKLYIQHTKLSPSALVQIVQFKQFEATFPGMKRNQCLRIASLIHFLVHQDRQDKAYIKRELTMKSNVHYSPNDFEFVWATLLNVGLLEQRKAMPV